MSTDDEATATPVPRLPEGLTAAYVRKVSLAHRRHPNSFGTCESIQEILTALAAALDRNETVPVGNDDEATVERMADAIEQEVWGRGRPIGAVRPVARSAARAALAAAGVREAPPTAPEFAALREAVERYEADEVGFAAAALTVIEAARRLVRGSGAAAPGEGT